MTEWQTVPREPTTEMIEAGCRAYMNRTDNYKLTLGMIVRLEYKTMLAVAPRQEDKTKPPGRNPSEQITIAAEAIYEACRQEAIDSARPVVPESYFNRDAAFHAQFLKTIERVCAVGYETTPEAEHDSWVEAYEIMGWKYAPVRDVKAKNHPDIVPFY